MGCEHRNGIDSRRRADLARLDETLREDLLARAARHRVDSGGVVLVEGTVPGGLVVVLSGRLAVLRPASRGAELFLYELRAGQVCTVSLLGAITGRRSPLSLVARTVAEVAIVPPEVVRSRFERDERFRGVMLDLLARRLETLLDDMEVAALWSREARLYDLLLARGPVVRMTHRELAHELGCSREWISRLLGALQAEGIVSCGHQKIAVRDTGRLEQKLAASRIGGEGRGERVRNDS